MVVVGPEAAGARRSDAAWLGIGEGAWAGKGQGHDRDSLGTSSDLAWRQWRRQGAHEAEREAVAAEELGQR